MENSGAKVSKFRCSSVTEQHDKIIILASSQEARKFKPVEGYVVIAVNSAIHVAGGNVDYWITVDPSESNMHIMRTKPYPAKYYAAVPWWFGGPHAKLARLKNCAIPDDMNYLNRVEGDLCDKYIKYGLCEARSDISTGNSAYGALNLAYHMNPKEIVILGVDGNRIAPKFDNKHCIGTLDHLPTLFESAVQQLTNRGIQVYNANKQTMLRCFPYSDIFD